MYYEKDMTERPMKMKLGKYIQTNSSSKNIMHTNNQYNKTDLYQKTYAVAWQAFMCIFSSV